MQDKDARKALTNTKKPKRIGTVHFVTDGTDGVSLEIQKRKRALESFGHKVFLIDNYAIPFLDIYSTPFYSALNSRYFKQQSIGQIINNIKRDTLTAFKSFYKLLNTLKLDLLYVHNLFSLPIIPAASLGLYKAIKKLGLKTIAVDHDFWDTRSYFEARLQSVWKKFPIKSKFIWHQVINSLDKHKLEQKGFTNVVIRHDIWDDSIVNLDKTKILRLKKRFNKRTIFLVATRIIPRKAIQNAILFVHYFNRLRLQNIPPGVLVLSNPKDKDDNYYKKLLHLAQKLKVAIYENTKPKYFWDFYQIADVILYPTLLEGFGNQFLEAMYFKKPTVVFEYQVFRHDIKPKGFKVYTLGHKYYTKDTLQFALESKVRQAVKELIKDWGLYKYAEHNFKLLNKYFGEEALLRFLKEDLGGFGDAN